MKEVWKHWEGQLLSQAVVLGPFLGGSEHSAVFLADYGEAQKAAVKLIPVDPEQAGTELCCLDAAAKLNHPNLVRLFDWGLCRKEDQHLLYVVMEYAPENLSQVLPERPLTAAETLEVLNSALDGLAYLHRQGFVHGHLTPSNILAVDEQVKISIDRLHRAGTPARALRPPSPYDPPEAMRGERQRAGDVWMLAQTMVEMLTQQLPGGEAGQAAVEKLPEPFVDIARHCLQENPRRRWPVDWVKARLTAETPPRKAQPAKQHNGIKVRRPVLSQVAAVGAVAAILAGAMLLLQHEAAPSNRETPVQPPALAAAERMQSRDRAIETDRTSAFGAYEPGRTGVVRQVLPKLPPKVRSAIRGKVEIGVVVQVDAAGNVIAARYETPGASEYFFDLALGAARSWRFLPAPREGAGIARTWILRFEFQKSGTGVQPVRVSEGRAAGG